MERRLSRQLEFGRLELARTVGHNRAVTMASTFGSLSAARRSSRVSGRSSGSSPPGLARSSSAVSPVSGRPRSGARRSPPRSGAESACSSRAARRRRCRSRSVRSRILLDPAYEDVADSLAEPQRHVLAAALGLETDGRGRPDRLALPRALVAALHALAAAAPPPRRRRRAVARCRVRAHALVCTETRGGGADRRRRHAAGR